MSLDSFTKKINKVTRILSRANQVVRQVNTLKNTIKPPSRARKTTSTRTPPGNSNRTA